MTMFENLFHIAFIGPGGPEFIVVMLVLLLMFGAKDAPRIFRKINEMLNQLRNTADGFKREILYSDVNTETSFSDESGEHQGGDYDYETEYNEAEYYGQDDPKPKEPESAYSDETFQNLENDLEKNPVIESEPEEEGGDAQKP